MNVSNNKIPYNKVNFGKIDKEEKMTLTKEEKLQMVLDVLKEQFALKVEMEMPENAKFMPFSKAFKIPETDNIGLMTVTYDMENPRDGRILSVGVFREHFDRVTSNVVLSGTKKEILNALNDKNALGDLLETVQDLSNQMDEYHS